MSAIVRLWLHINRLCVIRFETLGDEVEKLEGMLSKEGHSLLLWQRVAGVLEGCMECKAEE